MLESALYPIIRSQWPGVCVRIDSPSRPGISDLVLIGTITIFTEVKRAYTVRAKLDITSPQRRFIRNVCEAGGHACVLAYVLEDRNWYLITPEVLDREWPVVRAAMGFNLGTSLQSLEARIRSTFPVSGRKPVFGSSIATSTVAPVAGSMFGAKGKPESITSFR